MSAYRIAEELANDPNLLTAGDRLIAFFQAARQEKDYEKSLNHLYESMLRHIKPINSSDANVGRGGDYVVLGSKEASGVLLAQHLLSLRSTPAVTMLAIEQLGNDLKKTYSEPSGSMLAMHEALAVLEHLDSAVGLKDAIVTGGHAVLLLPYMHGEHNGQCMVLHDSLTDKVAVKILMFSCREGNDPRYVLCHELGHALHTMYCGAPEVEVPEEIMYYLEAFSPSIRTLGRDLQNEILADLLAVGMMYESPFADADPFEMEEEGKEFLHRFVRLMCWKTTLGRRSFRANQESGLNSFLRR